MPFAFSTLGCPDRTLQEVLELATSRGVDGLELRAAPDAVVHIGLDDQQRTAVREQCAAAGVQVLALASYLRVCELGDDEAFARDASDHLRLASDLGASYLRVFPGPGGAGAEGDERAVLRLTEIAPLAHQLGVRIGLETHDSHPRGADIAAILWALDERLPEHGVEVIWDALHPWRAGEDPVDTLQAVAPWLGYVQIKDADAGPDGALRAVGRGDLPLDRIAAELPHRGSLWWSLEWEKVWHPELAELPEALDDALDWYRRAVLPG
ncbi:sugar phosphate isomerase/epimerase family protein [Flexivirga oryzae]|uniref:Sugar phosphate isomerase/epimerase n=1 Tax=Flexivirga oryzae TaxID=1794944 RepID=A0A839N5L2_9MICO|nr:sugar phosphate isomerase/epimerase family protein [Flexivirga oryzae]MBB2890926.1 sugar phosphate isomerase/epimerase [Flexivirga oryzae]